MRSTVLALACVLFSGCTDFANSADPGNGQIVAQTPDASGPDASETVSLTGRLIGIPDYAMMIPDALVTVLDHPEIAGVMSDAEGRYELVGVPMNSSVTLLFEKEDFVPMVSRPLHVGTEDYEYVDLTFGTESLLTLVMNIMGEEPTENGGIVLGVIFSSSAGALDNAIVELTPSLAFGPVYGNEAGIPDVARTSTSILGNFMYVNVEPGEIELSTTHPDQPRCWAGGPDQAPHPLRIQIFPGTVTNPGSHYCSP